MKIAPSTPTLSIAATISSPVTCSGQFGTLCQGRFGVFASYTWTWESMIVIEKAPLCHASLAVTTGSCPEGPRHLAPDARFSVRYLVVGQAVAQQVSERWRQARQCRQLVGIKRDQDRTEYRSDGADYDGGVHHLVVTVDQLRQEQPEDQRELEDRRHHHQRRHGQRGIDKGLGDGDKHGGGEKPRQVFAPHASYVAPGARLEQDQRKEQRRRRIGEAARGRRARARRVQKGLAGHKRRTAVAHRRGQAEEVT